MKTRTKTLIGLAAGIAVAVALPVIAAGPDGPKGPGKAGRADRPGRAAADPGFKAPDLNTTRIVTMLDKRVDLTDEQEKQIRGILDETRAELKAQIEETRGKVKASREGIEKVLTEEQKQKIGEAAGQLFAGVAGFADAHGPAIRERVQAAGDEVRMRGAIASLDLTEEQREKLRAHHEAMREKHEVLRKEMEPKIEALREEGKKELESILTPKQQEQLKERLEQMPAGPDAGQRFGEGGPMQRWRDRREARSGGSDGPEGRGFRGPGRGGRPGPPEGAPDGPPAPPPPPDGGDE